MTSENAVARTMEQPNKEMERTKRNSGTGRRASRAGLVDRRFAAHLRRSADPKGGQCPVGFGRRL